MLSRAAATARTSELAGVAGEPPAPTRVDRRAVGDDLAEGPGPVDHGRGPDLDAPRGETSTSTGPDRGSSAAARIRSAPGASEARTARSRSGGSAAVRSARNGSCPAARSTVSVAMATVATVLGGDAGQQLVPLGRRRREAGAPTARTVRGTGWRSRPAAPRGRRPPRRTMRSSPRARWAPRAGHPACVSSFRRRRPARRRTPAGWWAPGDLGRPTAARRGTR